MTTSRSPRHGRVLVVDADDLSCRALSLIVQYDGHDVRQATTEAAARALLEEFRPDVVLLDPAVSAAVTRSCSASIILTSKPADRFDQRAIRWVAGRVARPFDFIELRQMVGREIARLRTLRRAAAAES